MPKIPHDKSPQVGAKKGKETQGGAQKENEAQGGTKKGKEETVNRPNFRVTGKPLPTAGTNIGGVIPPKDNATGERRKVHGGAANGEAQLFKSEQAGEEKPSQKGGSAKARRRLSTAATLGILGVLSVLWLVPLAFLLLKSFSKEGGTQIGGMALSSFTLKNYERLLTQTPFLRWYGNTLFIAACSCLITTAFVLSVSFAFSRLRFKGRKPLMNVMLVLGMFPGFMSMAAVYYILKVLLPNNYQSSAALIMVYSGSAALSYYVAKGFFDTVPRQIDEAARMDGANEWQLFSRIILPLSRSVIVYTVLTSFIAPWCDFIFSSYILKGVPDTGKYTVALGLYNLINADKSLLYTNFPVFCAGAVVVATPITLLFLWLQKYYVSGVTGGSVKG